jgi:hypothetical protein
MDEHLSTLVKRCNELKSLYIEKFIFQEDTLEIKTLRYVLNRHMRLDASLKTIQSEQRTRVVLWPMATFIGTGIIYSIYIRRIFQGRVASAMNQFKIAQKTTSPLHPTDRLKKKFASKYKDYLECAGNDQKLDKVARTEQGVEMAKLIAPMVIFPTMLVSMYGNYILKGMIGEYLASHEFGPVRKEFYQHMAPFFGGKLVWGNEPMEEE